MSTTSKDDPYGPSIEQVSTLGAKDPDGTSWDDHGDVEGAIETTVQTRDDARSKKYFRLSISSNFFFLVGAAIYLWMVIEGWQWATELAALPEPNYLEYYFNQLPPEQQACAQALGYDQRLWDTGGTPPEIDAFWDDLTPEQQDAAECLGNDQEKWDDYETDDMLTDDMLAEGDEAATTTVVDEDDTVFQVAVGDRQTRVTRFMIQYFVAAICFVVMGVLVTMRDRKLFHCFIIIAGLFGVISAMLVERNVQTSGIFNLLSAHFFFLEAIAIFRYHWRGTHAMSLSFPFTFSLRFADFLFIVGALIEVALSYFYLLDDYSSFSTSASAANISAQTFWVVCSLIYIVTDIVKEVKRRSHEKRTDNGLDDADVVKDIGLDNTEAIDDSSVGDTDNGSNAEFMPRDDISDFTKETVDV